MNNQDFLSEMWHLFSTIKPLLQKSMEPIISAEGLTQVQAFLLTHCAEGEDLTVGEISRHYGLNQGNVSSMCKELERLGLITRTRNPNDERVVLVGLTEQGRETIKRIYANMMKSSQIIFDAPQETLDAILLGMREFTELVKKINAEGKI